MDTCRGVELPRISTQDQRQFLTLAEVEHLAETIDPRYRALVLMAGYTGMRWGEAVALRVENFDFLRRFVTVQRTLTEVSGLLSMTSPKTPRSIRRISLPPFLIEAIPAHLSHWPAPMIAWYSPLPTEGLFVGPTSATAFGFQPWKRQVSGTSASTG